MTATPDRAGRAPGGLLVEGLACGYRDGPDVLHDVDVTVGEGEVVTLIGLNGAGKSTLVRAVSGLLGARRGTVTFGGRDLTRAGCDDRARAGLVHVPEGRELFPTMTVAQNLLLGTCALPSSARKGRTAALRDRVHELFPQLTDRASQRAGTLSGGEQQMLALGRALMGDPKLLLLDEPSLGLAPRVVEAIFDALRQLNASGLAILLVEQNASLALDFASRAYLMELGRIVHAGSCDELRAQGEAEALLGTAATSDHGRPAAARDGAAAAVHLPDYAMLGRRARGATATR